MTTSKISIEGFVLAGGASRRMGDDKALLDWQGRPLIDHMMSLLATVVSPVRAVGRGSLPDRRPGLGPMSGIATALSASTSSVNLIVAVDIPLLTREFLKYFADRACLSPRPLLACKLESRVPLCLAIRSDIRAAAETYLKLSRRSIHGFIEEVGAELLTEKELQRLGFFPDLFRNINTPEDYRQILAEGDGNSPPSSTCD